MTRADDAAGRDASEADDRACVVIAGCGDLGTEAGRRFVARGWRAIGLRRRPEVLSAPLEALAGDITGELHHAFEQLPDRVDALVLSPSPGERTEAAYQSVYVDGLANVLQSMEAAGLIPKRVLSVSSTAVYGIDDGSDVDEDTPTDPTTATGRCLVTAEETLHAYRPDAVVLRLAGIYGPGRTGLIDQVRAGTARVPDVSHLTNRIHRDDAAEAIVHLVVDVADPAPVYVGVDDAPVERAEVVAFLATELGVPIPAPRPHQRMRGGNKRCRNDALAATGFVWSYPTYREGYRALLAGRGRRHP